MVQVMISTLFILTADNKISLHGNSWTRHNWGLGKETWEKKRSPPKQRGKLRNPDAFTWTVKTLNTTDLFHTFPLGWSTKFLTWLALHRRKQGEWGKLREETEESSRNSSIPAIRNYSSCYFQHLQTVQNMVPKCHSAGGKEILLHEKLANPPFSSKLRPRKKKQAWRR